MLLKVRCMVWLVTVHCNEVIAQELGIKSESRCSPEPFPDPATAKMINWTMHIAQKYILSVDELWGKLYHLQHQIETLDLSEYACRKLIYGNVALNKTAYMSGVWEGNGMRLEAENAVDGLLGSRKLDSKSIAHTAHTKQPWLTVDLGHIYDVHHVILFNRRDDHGIYLHDVEIRIGNSSAWDNMAVCGTFEGPGYTYSVHKIMCIEPLKGQFVTFKIVKDNPSATPSIGNILVLSEVYIMAQSYVLYVC